MRANAQHRRHDDEDQYQSGLGDQDNAKRLQLPDQQAGEKRAGHATHTAHDHNDERLDDHPEVHLRVGRGVRQDQGPAQAG